MPLQILPAGPRVTHIFFFWVWGWSEEGEGTRAQQATKQQAHSPLTLAGAFFSTTMQQPTDTRPIPPTAKALGAQQGAVGGMPRNSSNASLSGMWDLSLIHI